MKTLFLIVLGAIFFDVSSFAQVTFWPKFGTNLSWTTFKLGYSYDQVTNKVKINTPLNVGIYGGVAMDIKIARHFSIRPELIYSQINASWGEKVSTSFSHSTAINYESDSRNEQRRYLTVPLNFVSSFKFRRSNFQITLGPYISRGLTGGSYQEAITSSSSTSTDIYTNHLNGKFTAGRVPLPWATSPSYYNSIDLGMNVGLGYRINRIMISSQYCLGFTNTQPHYAVGYSESLRGDVVTRNRSISIGAAYRISR